MSVERATGIVLRTRPLTETSLIVHWITAEHGRIAVVAKGAVRPKSAFRGKLDLFFTADFTFQRSRRSNLHTLREIALQHTHPKLRQDYARLRLATYGALLIEQISEEETPLPELFALLAELLAALGRQPAATELLLAFELKTLATSGLGPDPSASRMSAETRAAIDALLATELVRAGNLGIPPATGKELRQFLHGFIIYHLGRIPRGRPGENDL